MDGSLARAEGAKGGGGPWLARGWSALVGTPTRARALLLGLWAVTRAAMLLGVVVQHQYCDPQFYNYAGKFAAGLLPYRDVPVEYPPLAMVLILLPALALLPFGDIAPRPDAAFPAPNDLASLTHIPQPLDATRYGAYGTAFAVEMLLIDGLTLWLVLRAARRFRPGDAFGIGAGLLYILGGFLIGAIPAKFDLAVGTLCLAAVLCVVERRHVLGWGCLALATLLKGFPVLLIPVLAVMDVLAASGETPQQRLRAALPTLARHGAVLVGVVAAATAAVAAWAGADAVLHTVSYHSHRGTELESVYAAVLLAFGWLPGLHLTTAFNPFDLSRTLVSPFDGVIPTVSLIVLGALLVVAYGATARATLHVLRTGSGHEASQPVILTLGALAVILAFTLGFRALPVHYLLDALPLAAVAVFPSRRERRLVYGSLAAVALTGQAVIAAWEPLKRFEPWAVALLVLRDAAWCLAFVAVVAALGIWRGTVERRAGLSAPASTASGRGVATDAPDPATVPATHVERPPRARWGERLRSAPPIPGFTPRGEDSIAHLFKGIAPERVVTASSAVSLLIYVGFVAAFPILGLWNKPHVGSNASIINDMGHITGYSPVAAVLFFLAVMALFACQFFALVAAGRVKQTSEGAARGERIARRLILFAPVAFALVMIWMQPVTTTDLYGYVARGYLQAHDHLNPMISKATALPGGLTVNRPPSPYGPLWLVITAAVARVGGENLLLHMLLYKAITFAAMLGSLLLLDHLIRALAPARRLRAYVLFAWSPLLLFEAIGNGHNDIVMMFCVLVAFTAMYHRWSRMAFAFLVLGALVKYVSVVFIPLWLIYEVRQRTQPHAPASSAASPDGTAFLAAPSGPPPLVVARRVAITVADTWRQTDRKAVAWLLVTSAMLGAALFAVFYAPYWVGLGTFTGLGQQVRPLYYNGSLAGILSAPLQVIVPESKYAALDKTVRLLFYIVFACYAAIQARRLWLIGPDATLTDVITAAAKITFASLVLITFWFQPWYVVWLLPLAALAREPYVRRQGMILAAGALLTYAVSNFLFVNESDASRGLFVQFFMILVTFAPLLLLRAAPFEQGWTSVARRYAAGFANALGRRTAFWERVMLALVLVVAALLRLLRLGPLSAQIPQRGADSNTLSEISADLKLFLVDPQGLHGPFVAIEGLLVAIFGPTPLAALLPSAIIGTITVFLVYLLTREIMQQGRHPGAGAIALLAALLAATARWHVSLSRSGMEVVLLPALLCLALYWLLVALRLGAPVRVSGDTARRLDGSDVDDGVRKPRASARQRRLTARKSVLRAPTPRDERRSLWLYAGCGICIGLASDLQPGLWLMPLLVAGFLLVWRWRLPEWFTSFRRRLAILLGAALISSAPVLWAFASQYIGFAPGSPFLARASAPILTAPQITSGAFWGQAARNLADVVRLLASQDYSSGYPSVGGAAILPAFLGPVFYVGLVLILARWRQLTSLALLLLIAMPIVASVTIGAPTGVIEAASVLPATCIVPALALYEIVAFLGHLPIVLDRVNGVRIFSTPEQIGRILLLTFLVISTIRTFYWYFEATLPVPRTDGDFPTLRDVPTARLHIPDGAEPPYRLTSAATSAAMANA